MSEWAADFIRTTLQGQNSIIVYIVSFALLVCIVAVLFRRSRGRHYFKRRAAKRVYTKVKVIEHPGAVLEYLRRVDPFAFEELILDALSRRGHRIVRNKRYTGDGGVDGKFYFNGHEFLIQAKRYSGHINARHVEQFNRLCEQKSTYGLFVHTGRTGAQSKPHHYDSVTMLSGTSLIALITSTQPLRLQLNQQHFIVI